MSLINLLFLQSLKGNSRQLLKVVGAVGAASFLGYECQNYFNNNNNNNNNRFTPGKKLIGTNLVAAQLFTASQSIKKFDDYQKVYNDIATKLQEEDEYDDGSYGPILVRLAWHQSGTYRKNPKADSGCPYSGNTGGSFGGTMRYPYEADEPGNAGLKYAREFLEEFKAKYPWLSYGDLYTLGGVVSVQELGGPKTKWKAGREDLPSEQQAPHGRLPDGGKGADHIREVFGPQAMGFNDQEIVALIGAHCLGRCHPNASGFDGPWTFSPTFFTNEFYKLLLNEKWHIRNWDGPRQYEDDKTNSLMMLPADYALIEDPKFKKWVVAYAKDQDLFFKDFAKAFQSLLELGIVFPKNTQDYIFKTLDEQDS